MQHNLAINHSLKDHLVELEGRRRAALVARDFDSLAPLFAEDLIYVHSIGNVQDKPTYLTYVQGPMSFLSIDRGPLTVRQYGDTAVMTGTMTNTLTGPSLPVPVVVQAMVVQVWRETSQGWQIIHFQATRLPVEQPRT